MGTTFLPVVLRRPQKTADNCCLFGSSRFRCKEVYLSFHFLLVSFFFSPKSVSVCASFLTSVCLWSVSVVLSFCVCVLYSFFERTCMFVRSCV